MKTRPVREILAENLKRAMDQHSTLNTQAKLGVRSGVAQRTVGRMRNGEADPQLSHVEAVANALGIPLIDLLTDQRANTPALHYDRNRFAKLSEEDRGKIQTFIDFIFASQGVRSNMGDATISVAETIEPTAPQREMVNHVAQRRQSKKTLSIDEDKNSREDRSRKRR